MLKQQGYETGVYAISCVQTNQAHFMMFLGWQIGLNW
jgi:hypothetical protein